MYSIFIKVSNRVWSTTQFVQLVYQVRFEYTIEYITRTYMHKFVQNWSMDVSLLPSVWCPHPSNFSTHLYWSMCTGHWVQSLHVHCATGHWAHSFFLFWICINTLLFLFWMFMTRDSRARQNHCSIASIQKSTPLLSIYRSFHRS